MPAACRGLPERYFRRQGEQCASISTIDRFAMHPGDFKDGVECKHATLDEEPTNGGYQGFRIYEGREDSRD
jgi:hypothetical protein